MTHVSTSTQNATTRRRRRRWGSYRLSIEARAAAAAEMVRERSWSQRQAAAAFCVNAAYLGRVLHLTVDDQLRLSRGEVKLYEVYKDYRRRLADRRAQRVLPPSARPRCRPSARRRCGRSMISLKPSSSTVSSIAS